MLILKYFNERLPLSVSSINAYTVEQYDTTVTNAYLRSETQTATIFTLSHISNSISLETNTLSFLKYCFLNLEINYRMELAFVLMIIEIY